MAPSDSSSSQSRSSRSSSAHNTFTQASSSSSQHVRWQHDYEAAMAETDTHTLFKLVEVAEAAVLSRRASLEGSADHHSERQALEAALSSLKAVKRDRLNFR